MSAVPAPSPSAGVPVSPAGFLLLRVIRAEWIVAPVCAALLLLHPTPLTWPAALAGLGPSLARLVLFRRPWQPTPFDVPLALIVAGGLVGALVALDTASAGIRLAGLISAVILFAWIRESARTPQGADRVASTVLIGLIVGAALLVHIAQPFLRLDRVPPLGWLAAVLEPWGLYRLLVADPGALQRFRWYASGAGALAAVGLCVTAALALDERRRWRLAGLVLAGLLFAGLLVASDNRGSMVAAALTIGTLVVWWRPKLLVLALLVVFGTLDLIAFGMVQRGLNLRTVVERLEFWRNGLLLSAETPWTGVGLGAPSVELAYRAAFQPAYPPFNHTHSIYVQGLLEQGVPGLVGLLLLALAVVRVGTQACYVADSSVRGAGLAAGAGALALLTAGLTEIVALTTLGGALLAVMLGLLAGAAGQPRRADATPLPWPRWVRAPAWRRMHSRRVAIGVGALVLLGILVSGLARPLLASPFLNAGTTLLYRGSLQEGRSRSERTALLRDADHWLKIANTLDPTGVPAWRNRALAAAAAGDRPAARQLADTALLHADPADHLERFGVGRAYAAAEAWEQTVTVWEQAAAGPQLLRLGQRLSTREDTPSFEQGLRALKAAAMVGAPGRLAQDAVARAVIRQGGTVDQALGHLDSLLVGGPVEYQTRLQVARELIRAGQPDRAEAALAAAEAVGSDPQLALLQGMLLLLLDWDAAAEIALTGAADALRDESLPVPDGDDPRFWLAAVQARQGKYEQAVATARAGLAQLPSEQASLRVPYRQLLGDSLLALGRAEEAISVYEAGLRLAPENRQLRESIARARAAAGR